MDELDDIPQGDKPPGSVTTFMRKYRQGHDRGEVAVPCGECDACCRSPTVFADLTQEEAARFPDATQAASGQWRLPKNADGSCAYLANGKCSIHAARPRSCRLFDCRLSLLAGATERGDAIMWAALSQWKMFSTPLPEDLDTLIAIRLAVADGGIPETRQEANVKSAKWPRYLDAAREIRQTGRGAPEAGTWADPRS